VKSKPPPPGPTPPPRVHRESVGRPDRFEAEEPPSQSPPPFYSEPPTKQKNVTASVYQSLLSVFDEMTAEQRMEFVEFAARYATLDAESRRRLIELMPIYGALRESDRVTLDELATRLAARRR